MQTFYTVKQTAYILGVSPPTVYRFVDEKLLQAVVVRRVRKRIIRIRQEAIDKFVRDRETHK